MYGLEGLVMLLLLIWGIIWIYQSLNRMLGLNRRQNNFMLAITHELKTPIASAKLYQETLLKRKLEPEHQFQIIRNTLTEINRLRDLVDNILLASQLETTTFEIQPAELNLSKLVTQSIENFASPRNMNNRFRIDVEENIFVTTDEQAMEAIVTNLISNAAKYSPAEMPITIALLQDATKTILRISDLGSGIGEKDKKRIFDKFYRIGDETTRKTKGTGLGLFIVKNLANRLGAELLVKDNVPNGTIFELILKQ
jgi:signal transduction histidine kinase